MSSLTRLTLSVALLLIAGLIAGAVLEQAMHRQSAQLAHDLIDARRQQLAAALALARTPAPDSAQLAAIGASIGADVAFASEPTPPRAGRLTFVYPLADGRALRVTLAKPAAWRALSVSTWTLAVLLLLVLAGLPVAYLLGSARRAPAEPAASAADVGQTSLARLAETTAAQTVALDRERAVRRRAEDDAQLKQRLLTQSLEDKIRLGHDLHDGIIQSLYAVGLTLESARTLLPRDPAAADQRLEQCRDALNGTIREVRAYITGLAPQNLSSATFLRTLQSLLGDLARDRGTALEFKIEADATARLTSEQATEVVQIAREAVSNAVRHGRARHIVIAAAGDHEFAFSIADDGSGFDPATARSSGFGLHSLQARAARLAGRCEVHSQPGAGTRVSLVFPFPSAPA